MQGKVGTAPDGAVPARRDERLKSWKEIAAFFGADERTVRRWESRGLPVHRIPGGARTTVYADVAELQAWMLGRDAEVPAAPTPAPAEVEPPPTFRQFRWLVGLVLAAVLAAALIFAFAGRRETAPAAAAHQPPQAAVDLYLAGSYQLERRTAESLERARDLFGRAIAEDPAYADAYSGLASTYLLLREYSGLSDAEAYAKARDAAQRAIALNPQLADAHAALAFADFYGAHDWPRALAGFQRAVELDPRSARSRHWYGTALLHAARFDEALAQIDAAARHDPGSRSIRADRALILSLSGRSAEGVAELQALAASEPEFYSPHAYLARIHLSEGRYEDYLRAARAAAELRKSPDELELVAEAERGFRGGGGAGMLQAMAAVRLRQLNAGRGSNYALASIYARAGDRDATLRSLRAAQRAGENSLLEIRVDPMFRSLRGDPEFRDLADSIGRPG